MAALQRYPLDPLTADEIRRASSLLSKHNAVSSPNWRFASLDLLEPKKAAMKAWLHDHGPRPAREAFAVVWRRAEVQGVYEAVVDLDAGVVRSFIHLPNVQANFTLDEYHECDEALRKNELVLEALAKRGITDMSLVLLDVWPYGRALIPKQYRGRRVGFCDVWLRKSKGSNPYAHLVSGMRPIVDMNTMELLELQDDHDLGMLPVMGEYDPNLVPGLVQRTDIKPLLITQPEGPSFTLDGYHLRWQNWNMRLGFNAREALILHQVGFEDKGRVRPVAHRLSFAEMVVPYRDPSYEHEARTAYDIGEWGLGNMAESLTNGCDCLGSIRYLDVTLADALGEPFETKNCVCIHEEDNAVLWKHVDYQAGAEVRRMRRLTISFHSTVANYEYLVYWRFYQDGSIECEVRATGIMVTTPIPPDQAISGKPIHGTRVDNGTHAPFHQHFIVARLDMDVDGEENTVYETSSFPQPYHPVDNRYGVGLLAHAEVIASERDSARDVDWASQRTWKICSSDVKNAHGDPTAYKLIATSAIPPMMLPNCISLKRAPVIAHPVWITQFSDNERYPAGPHPTLSAKEVNGISHWIKADRDLVDSDIVLWHVFGLHHIPRAEDWPVMPSDPASFWLKPFGFFDRNPALDLPPEPPRSKL